MSEVLPQPSKQPLQKKKNPKKNPTNKTKPNQKNEKQKSEYVCHIIIETLENVQADLN